MSVFILMIAISYLLAFGFHRAIIRKRAKTASAAEQLIFLTASFAFALLVLLLFLDYVQTFEPGYEAREFLDGRTFLEFLQSPISLSVILGGIVGFLLYTFTGSVVARGHSFTFSRKDKLFPAYLLIVVLFLIGFLQPLVPSLLNNASRIKAFSVEIEFSGIRRGTINTIRLPRQATPPYIGLVYLRYGAEPFAFNDRILKLAAAMRPHHKAKFSGLLGLKAGTAIDEYRKDLKRSAEIVKIKMAAPIRCVSRIGDRHRRSHQDIARNLVEIAYGLREAVIQKNGLEAQKIAMDRLSRLMSSSLDQSLSTLSEGDQKNCLGVALFNRISAMRSPTQDRGDRLLEFLRITSEDIAPGAIAKSRASDKAKANHHTIYTVSALMLLLINNKHAAVELFRQQDKLYPNLPRFLSINARYLTIVLVGENNSGPRDFVRTIREINTNLSYIDGLVRFLTRVVDTCTKNESKIIFETGPDKNCTLAARVLPAFKGAKLLFEILYLNYFVGLNSTRSATHSAQYQREAARIAKSLTRKLNDSKRSREARSAIAQTLAQYIVSTQLGQQRLSKVGLRQAVALSRVAVRGYQGMFEDAKHPARKDYYFGQIGKAQRVREISRSLYRRAQLGP